MPGKSFFQQAHESSDCRFKVLGELGLDHGMKGGVCEAGFGPQRDACLAMVARDEADPLFL